MIDYKSRWNSSYSHRFPVKNWVRQGAVSSPLLFSVYIDGLIKELRKSGLGCYLDTHFYGCLGYADDLLLLSASRSGLQSMVKICENFADSKCLAFSTNVDPSKSKTKCIIFSKKKVKDVQPILLNGDPLPWVVEVKHLGNMLQADNSMKADCVTKRGKFIGKVNSFLQEFYFVAPRKFMELLNIYATSFYGSYLWDLYSKDVDRIYKSWNVTIRNVFCLPCTTHRYFMESVSGCAHPKTLLSSRFVKFAESLTCTTKTSIRYLASLVKEDNRTLMGRTLSKIKNECGVADLSLLSPRLVKDNLKYFDVPQPESWRIGLLSELLDARAKELEIEDFSKKQIEEMIDVVCTS